MLQNAGFGTIPWEGGGGGSEPRTGIIYNVLNSTARKLLVVQLRSTTDRHLKTLICIYIYNYIYMICSSRARNVFCCTDSDHISTPLALVYNQVFTPMLAAAAVGTVEYRSILEHIRSANPVIEYTQGTQFSRHGDFLLLLVDQGRSEPFLLYVLGFQHFILDTFCCISWPFPSSYILVILVPQGAFFDLPDSSSRSAGTCENVDLEKKELLIRPYPPGLEDDFTLPYDVPWPQITGDLKVRDTKPTCGDGPFMI